MKFCRPHESFCHRVRFAIFITLVIFSVASFIRNHFHKNTKTEVSHYDY